MLSGRQPAKGIKVNTKRLFSTTSELGGPPESWGEGDRGQQAEVAGKRHPQSTTVNRPITPRGHSVLYSKSSLRPWLLLLEKKGKN